MTYILLPKSPHIISKRTHLNPERIARPYHNRHLSENNNGGQMNDDQPFSVLATVGLLDTMRIEEGGVRCKDGENAQLRAGLMSIGSRQHRGQGTHRLCVIKRDDVSPEEVQQGGIPILRCCQARHNTRCFRMAYGKE
jgi:hypothetical protein